MLSTMLGIICSVAILADYFGYKVLSGIPYFMCWVVVIAEATGRIGINLYQKEDE